MIDTRYKKLTGMHAGHIFVVTAPASEMDTPMTWVLHAESNADERMTVNENELADRKRWEPLK